MGNGEGRRFAFGAGFSYAQAGETFTTQSYAPSSVIENFAPSGLGYAAKERGRLNYAGAPIEEAPNGETQNNWDKRLNLLSRPRNL